MTSELESVFRELGLVQYLDTFVEHGFDSWDTILDIQESDLDALSVKLGHRRKLQRRIANVRGFGPGASLVSPSKACSDDGKHDGTRSEGGRDSHTEMGGGVTKRKYRRHPKPDENAPERPPSAYVLFSNKMREDLKSQNLTFTEIAKLVGENWQNLASVEKEAYESQANAAKEKYHRDLVEYKKTSEYRRYAQYLQDFKDRQAKQSHVHDSAKRPKFEPARLRHGSSSGSSVVTGGLTSHASGSTSTSGSGSERVQDSEPPPTRSERMSSTASMTDPRHSPTSSACLPHQNSWDEARQSPTVSQFDHARDRDARHAPQHATWRESGPRRGDAGQQQNLPSLSDMLEDGKIGIPAPSAEGSLYASGFVAANRRRPILEGLPALSRVPPRTFHHEQSTDSNTSLSSAASYGRSGDGPLPLHALLTKPAEPASYERHSLSPISMGSGKPTSFGKSHSTRGYGFRSVPSALDHMKVDRSADGDIVMSQADPITNVSNGQHRSRDSYDGMNALLQAGEIVGRRS